jgi:hypothetical protein
MAQAEFRVRYVLMIVLAVCCSRPNDAAALNRTAVASAASRFQDLYRKAPQSFFKPKPAPSYIKPRTEVNPSKVLARSAPAIEPEHGQSESAQLHSAEQRSSVRKRLASLVASISNSIPRVAVASATVKNFGVRFKAGFDDPERAFYVESDSQPQVRDHIQSWLSAPKERRIFITGARSDTPFVELMTKRLEADGNVVFFYQHCAQLARLCAEETVGAHCATAGQVISVNSADARKSEYTILETRIIDSKVTGTTVFIISAEQLQQAISHTTHIASMGAAASAITIAGQELALEDAASHR